MTNIEYEMMRATIREEIIRLLRLGLLELIEKDLAKRSDPFTRAGQKVAERRERGDTVGNASTPPDTPPELPPALASG